MTAREAERHGLHEAGFWDYDTEKRARGRPRAVPKLLLEYARSTQPDVRSRRGLQDVAYRHFAMGRIVDEPDCRWLMAEGSGRRTILTELGRIGDSDELVALAKAVCASKPKARDAVRVIRAHRLSLNSHGRAPAVSHTIRLADALCGVINDYRTRHPDTTGQDVWDSLENVRAAIQAVEQDAGGGAVGE